MKTFKTPLLLGFLSLILGCHARQLPNPPELYLQAAAMRLEQDDPRGAADMYAQMLEAKPDPRAWFGLSMARLQMGDTAGALDAFFNGLMLQEEQKLQDPIFWMKKGRWFGRKGELDSALACFERALSLDRNSAKALNNIGVVHFQKGDYETALKFFKKSVKLNGSDPSVWHNIGLSLHHLGKDPEAISAYMTSLHLAEARAQTWNDLGVSYKFTGQNDKALRCYDRALELSPSNADIWQNKALLLMETGQLEDALFCFRKQAQISLSPEAYLKAAQIAEKLHKTKLAASLVDTSLYLNPLDPKAWALDVKIAFETKGKQAALTEINRARKYIDVQALMGYLETKYLILLESRMRSPILEGHLQD